MLHIADRRGRSRPLALAAALLLALCLLAAGAQAVQDGAETAAITLSPYNGPHPVPGYVQAEDFDVGGEGVAYHDVEPANLGGAYRPSEGVDIEKGQYITNVGWIRSGEWLDYTITATEAQPVYLNLLAANPDATTKRVTYSLNGTVAGTVDVHPTGGFEQYDGHVSTPITFPAGETVLRLSFDGVQRINLDTLGLESMGPTPPPTPAPDLLVDTPGLHTLDRDLTTDWIGVRINSSDVVLDGMGHSIVGTNANTTGVSASGTRSLWSSGVLTNVTIRNLTVHDCGAGIGLGLVSGPVVEDVVSERNTVGLAAGTYVETGDEILVRDSAFRENSRAGIELGFEGRGISIEGCSITGNGEGLSLDYFRSSDRMQNRIVDSTVSGNAGNGISIEDISGLQVADCTVSGNGGDGIYVEHGGSEVVGCHIQDNAGAGVQSSDRGNSDIHGNWIEGNGMGVVVGGDWSSMVRNNYLNNTDNGFFGASTAGLLNYEKTAGTNIVGGPFLGGNFWANPSGTGFSQTHPDADGDGICDEPFVMEDSTDALPLAPWNGTPGTVPTPYRPHPVPGRVEAEDYDVGGEGIAYHDTTPGNTGGAYRHDGVDIEIIGGITDVGWVRDGEWLLYTLDVPTAGDYQVSVRAASPNSDRTATISVNAQPMNSVRFTNTGSFERYTTVVEDHVYLPAGNVTFRVTFHGDGVNLDWIELAPQPDTPTPGTVYLPATIQAEDYLPGGYVDTTPGNSGGAYRQDDVDIEAGGSGYDVGWIRTGEFLTYGVYARDGGTFQMSLRVASPNSGRTIVVSDSGGTLATIAVPNTGSFSTYRTVTVPITLSQYYHALKLTFQGDGQNLDWIAFATGPVVTPTPTPEPSGGASFVAVPTTAPHGSAVKFTVTPAVGKTIGSA
jgi:parallel beta-helix repeat protein